MNHSPRRTRGSSLKPFHGRRLGTALAFAPTLLASLIAITYALGEDRVETGRDAGSIEANARDAGTADAHHDAADASHADAADAADAHRPSRDAGRAEAGLDEAGLIPL